MASGTPAGLPRERTQDEGVPLRTANAVKASWKDCGLVEPTDDNFYSAMNALREKLKKLGIACHSKRGEGYFLTATASSSEAEPI